MVMGPTGAQVKPPGVHTTEPTLGLPATWVDIAQKEEAQKEEATIKGYTVVDAATVLSTHLTELLKSNTAELLSYAEVHKLIKELPKEQAELIKDIVPGQITVSGIQRVLQILLEERVSIRDFASILEGIADALAFTRNPVRIAEHVRTRLSRQLCAQHTTPIGYLPQIARRLNGSKISPTPSSARATNGAWRCNRRKCSSPRRASGHSCAESSSASVPRPACYRSRRSIREPA
jgi:flagellar biosynthesis protein FlhA